MRTGGCQCGNIRYQCAAQPSELYVCHCTNCRAQSASAFGISFIVPATSFRLTRGEPEFWEWETDSGNRAKGAFCPTCGTRLWHQDHVMGEMLSVKGGSLDEAVDITDAMHIWVSSRLPGVMIPEHVTQHEREPD